MKITIFTPNFNNGKYLSQCIESVLNQTHSDFEYLIYDDGSTDNSKDVINKYDDSRIEKFFLEKQDNVGVIINKSFEKSDGDYWCWCPSDDFFKPNLLESNINFSKKYTNSVIYSNGYKIDDNDKVINRIYGKLTDTQFKDRVFNCPGIAFTGIFIPKNIYKNNPFPIHLKYSEDFYWMIKSTIKGVKFNLNQEQLHYKRIHNNSLTFKNYDKINANVPNIRNEIRKYANDNNLL